MEESNVSGSVIEYSQYYTIEVSYAVCSDQDNTRWIIEQEN